MVYSTDGKAYHIQDVYKRQDLLTKKDSVVIAVSEGIKLADGRYVCELGSSSDYVDNFGHKQLQGTAAYLANFLAGECGCKTRAVEFSTLQRKMCIRDRQNTTERQIPGRERRFWSRLLHPVRIWRQMGSAGKSGKPAIRMTEQMWQTAI